MKKILTTAIFLAIATAVHAEGDAKKGKRFFNKCKACHTLKEDNHKSGPSLYGILGATSGSAEGFDYSSEMAEAGLTWDDETLAAFLANPREVVPGNSMTFPGLKKEEEIANLIAYIREELE